VKTPSQQQKEKKKEDKLFLDNKNKNLIGLCDTYKE